MNLRFKFTILLNTLYNKKKCAFRQKVILN